ncbi:head decoration protein [Pararhizobium haloflavum]|uniref:head decoration protein n=1 Tax=Pararhizobium haloflavum TaxID=2037914 RepID=UPI001FDEC053|nr:head decoration protein [Pararhizobium haloflavum]
MPNIMHEDVFQTAHYIVSEAHGYRSRDVGVIAAGAGKLRPGAVLGRVTASGKYVPFDPAGADGSETAAAILYEGCDATDADQRRTLTVRATEIHADVLVFADGVDDTGKSAALADLAASEIVAR